MLMHNSSRQYHRVQPAASVCALSLEYNELLTAYAYAASFSSMRWFCISQDLHYKYRAGVSSSLHFLSRISWLCSIGESFQSKIHPYPPFPTIPLACLTADNSRILPVTYQSAIIWWPLPCMWVGIESNVSMCMVTSWAWDKSKASLSLSFYCFLAASIGGRLRSQKSTSGHCHWLLAAPDTDRW